MTPITIIKAISFCLLCLTTVFSNASEIYNQLPDKIDSSKGYVFYSHGYIVEGENPKPVDTRFGWGLYDFPAIKTALADDDYVLIATHRPKNTNPFDYSTELSLQVRELVEKGVDPNRITLIGFSRGAFITGLTSNALADIGANTIILAGCGRLISSKHDDIQVHGHVLSIYEKSDRASTCQKLKEKSTNIASFEEIEIDTGLEHGAFYRPIPEWVVPVTSWIKAKHAK